MKGRLSLGSLCYERVKERASEVPALRDDSVGPSEMPSVLKARDSENALFSSLWFSIKSQSKCLVASTAPSL